MFKQTKIEGLTLRPYPASIPPTFRVIVSFTHAGQDPEYFSSSERELTIRRPGDEDLKRWERPSPRRRSDIRAKDVRAAVEEILANVRERDGLKGIVVTGVDIRAESLVAWTHESEGGS